jgi:hypothetical protein
MFFFVSDSQLPRKGDFPHKRIYNKTPVLQISDFSENNPEKA